MLGSVVIEKIAADHSHDCRSVSAPNEPFPELRKLINSRALDLLRTFSVERHEELSGGQSSLAPGLRFEPARHWVRTSLQ